jgi:hypothetical protein
LDNDIIANDINKFEIFLDKLISLRSKYNSFEILMAEIITKDITPSIIKKMVLAGFKTVQIGYESPSSELLSAIKKKNTFASNLLCIKWGIYYGLKFSGANVLRNLLEETTEHIKESIKNLHYLRFFLITGSFKHNMSFLAITENSKYFRILKQIQLNNYESFFLKFMPVGYINQEDKYTLLMDFVKTDYNRLWDVFESVESYYLKNKYDYKLINNDNIIYYRESFNNVDIKELEFETDSLYWCILTKCNLEVLSLTDLQNIKQLNALSPGELLNMIECLKNEGLLYCNANKSEIVTIINTDSILSC